MKSLVNLIIFAFLISSQLSVQCEVVMLHDALYFNLTTTSRADVFVAQNQRQYAATTKEQETRLADFKELYATRIELLGYNEDFLERQLQDLENKLNPLELLNDISDYCVQKYRSKMQNLAKIRTDFAACLSKANAAYPPLVSAPTTTFNNLKNYFANTFANALKDCKKKFEQMESNYTMCVVTVVKTTSAVANGNMHTFYNQMKSAECAADLKVREAFDCYSNVVKIGLNSISEVWALVDNCMTGHELCPTCSDEAETQKGRCPYQMSWHLGPTDLSSEKITNPFKGINTNTPCLQINFINKSVQLQ